MSELDQQNEPPELRLYFSRQSLSRAAHSSTALPGARDGAVLGAARRGAARRRTTSSVERRPSHDVQGLQAKAHCSSSAGKEARKEPKRPTAVSMSATPTVSRIECMESEGTPRSTVRTPVLRMGCRKVEEGWRRGGGGLQEGCRRVTGGLQEGDRRVAGG